MVQNRGKIVARSGQGGAVAALGIIFLAVGGLLFVFGLANALSPGGSANYGLVLVGALMMLVGGFIIKFAD